ncbi:hypothetical protein CHS0354_022707 [Potamilus streckersoni]|uniref:Tetratricopeptide repeat protein 5 OB fold domain-containing protein n=1 Tax=Potamilus streckersoni TaxID=2493646 RepID=A0AAE0RTC1_9BIVA|nr:hypothetical protein CHS0354_022707 [Potamilus streckersoni]
MAADINNLSAAERAKAAVDDLYDYRDHYLERNGLEKAAQKPQDVQQKMNEILQLLEELKDGIKNKAEFCMLKGKVLNVQSHYDSQAEECLSKAIKLDPKLVEAWNNLGECYWKKGEIPSAKNCFTGALTHSKNKFSLRSLSMVLRQLSGSPAERAKLTEESVEKAREAVQLDITDGESWLILGNAYLSMFFMVGQNPKFLKQAMSAYSQAEKDTVTKNNADLHFNRAMAYKYQEEYQLALEGFNLAARLDPSWSEPTEQENKLMVFLTNVTELMDAKGKIKGKRLQTMVQSPRESDLGPYKGGSYTSHSGKTVKLERCTLSRLKTELNAEKVVVGRVVCSIPSDDPVPFTFCLIDEEETCVPVNVYNLAQGSGVKIGDTVAVPEPYLQLVKVNHRDKSFEYQSIRVDTPVVLVVNGRKLGLDKQAPTVLTVSAISD